MISRASVFVLCVVLMVASLVSGFIGTSSIIRRSSTKLNEVSKFCLSPRPALTYSMTPAAVAKNKQGICSPTSD